jgi:hypothetical protein
VAVKLNGAIATYQPITQAAKDYVNDIPLDRFSNSNITNHAEMPEASLAKFLY